MAVPLARWVAPFGDPGINDRSHLPRAFRSVPRPSSPLSAKASTRCPLFALERHTQRQEPSRYQKSDITGQNHGCGKLFSQKTLRDPGCTALRPRTVSRYGHTTRFFTICRQQRPRPSLAGPGRGKLVFMPRESHPRWRPGWRPTGGARVVEVIGLEPTTPCLQSRCSPS